MNLGWERIEVELPFLDQLVALGWKPTTEQVPNRCQATRNTFGAEQVPGDSQHLRAACL